MISRRIDQILQQINHDYTEKRKNDYIMSLPKVTLVQGGAFHRHLTSRDKVTVQSKVPRITKDLTVITKILAQEAVLTT